MLDRIDRIHQKEAAVHLQIMLELSKRRAKGRWYRYSLITFALITYNQIDEILQPSSSLRICDILSHCYWICERINTTCVGLIETHGLNPSSSPHVERHRCSNIADRQPESKLIHPLIEQNSFEKRKIEHYLSLTTVDFLHRTTFDFFSEFPKGKHFLRLNTPSEFDSYEVFTKAHLEMLLILSPQNLTTFRLNKAEELSDYTPHYFSIDTFETILDDAIENELKTGKVHTTL